jgi:DNA polymerase (family 10)
MPRTRVQFERPPGGDSTPHTALEINAYPDRLDLNDELVRRAREHRVAFAIDTDVTLART